MGGASQSKSLCESFVFDAASITHPGTILLPPTDILSYPTLPNSVMKQISQDGQYYDFYGKLGGAFEDSMIDSPSGSAKFDYEQWLQRNPEIHQEINKKIKGNFDAACSKEKMVIPDLDHLTKKDVQKLERITKQLLISMENNEHQAIEWIVIEEDKKDQKKPKKNPLSQIADLIQESMFDWKPSNSEKEDRNKLIMRLARIYFNKEVDLWYAASAAVLYSIQYLWKAKHHMTAKFDESQKRLRKIISNTVNQRFILLNRDRMVHFKDKILDDCHRMAKILDNIDFQPLFDKKMSEFYKEFEEANMEMVTTVTNKYVDQATEQSKGGIFGNNDIDENAQKLFLERAMSECDQNSVHIFEQLSSKYHKQVKEEMEQLMFTNLLLNLQGQQVSFLNLQNLQNSANVQPQLAMPAPLYLGNLEAINLTPNLQQASFHSSIQSALY